MSNLHTLTEKLTATENLQTTALDAAELGVWIWNIKTDELTWDHQMLAIFNVSREEFIDNKQFFNQLIHPDDLQRVEAAVVKAIEKRTPFYCSYRLKNKDKGMPVVITAKGRVLFSKVDNTPITMCGVAYRERLGSTCYLCDVEGIKPIHTH
jgi:PAS domain-containing protein